MVPVTKVSKLLGEILLILKHIYSAVFSPLFQGFCILKQGQRRKTHGPLSQISPVSQIYRCKCRVQSDKQRHRVLHHKPMWKQECYLMGGQSY